MALANVAVELAQRGRRVLVVDFDLEAPGLDTFELLRPQEASPGIVDFVGEYLGTGEAPAVERFVREVPSSGDGRGALWIMPAGAQQDSYAGTLASIDWGDLYERHDGYLLFEDLKAQWEDYVKPDYVLVDSRTGHTDVGGICTRQLPHAVSILFFPNDQNLRGLTKVVQDIRGEARTLRRKEIKLHFIMSNVPDLDDENQILERSMETFRSELGFEESLMIHRYDSLALLNQVVFTKDRPKSRLATEYRTVAETIIRHNLADREGALDFLEEIVPMRWPRLSRGDWPAAAPRSRFRNAPWTVLRESWVRQPDEIDDRLAIIQRSHWDDGEILFLLGSHRDRTGSSRKAVELFDRAIEVGYQDPEVYLRRAEIRKQEVGDVSGAQADAMNVIGSPDASPGQVVQAISIIGEGDLNSEETIVRLSSRSAEDLVVIAQQLNSSLAEAELARVVLQRHVAESSLPMKSVSMARHVLAMACVAVGKFTDAINALQPGTSDSRELNLADSFNYAMARWGETRRIAREPFERVLAKAKMESNEHPGPNYLQCMAVAHWAVGDGNEAKRLAQSALEEIQSRGGQEVSCWRYLRVSASEFEEDVGELLRLIDGDETVRPRFFTSSE